MTLCPPLWDIVQDNSINDFVYGVQAMDLFDMSDGFSSLKEGVSRVTCPVLVSFLPTSTQCMNIPAMCLPQVLGVTSDILFPVQQQREMSELLQKSGSLLTTVYIGGGRI